MLAGWLHTYPPDNFHTKTFKRIGQKTVSLVCSVKNGQHESDG